MPHIKPEKPLKNPVAITANLVLKGQTVYLMESGFWSNNLADAAIAFDKAQQLQLLDLGQLMQNTQYVLGVYSFEVTISEGVVTPISMREKIRATKQPTIIPVGLSAKKTWRNEFTKANQHANQLGEA